MYHQKVGMVLKFIVNAAIVMLIIMIADAGTARAIEPPHNEDNNINCNSCHVIHAYLGKPGPSLTKSTEINDLCDTCHIIRTSPVTHEYRERDDQGNPITDDEGELIIVKMTCTICHNSHMIEKGNLCMLRSKIKTPRSGMKDVTFTSDESVDSFIHGAPNYDGMCEICHTRTNYHRNNDSGDHNHNNTTICTECHPHNDGLAGGGCMGCHSEAKGPRREVVGEFDQTSHHVSGEVEDADCVVCHDMGAHMGGTVRLKDPDAEGNIYNPANAAELENFCLRCHDGNGANGNMTPLNDGQTVPDVNNTLWANSAHNKIGYPANGGNPITCLGDGSTTGCHANGHGSANVKLLNTGVTIDQSCYNCHSEDASGPLITNNALSGGSLADDIEQAFSSVEKHDLGTSFTIGSNTYTLRCTTCHNPHVVTGKHWDVNQGKSPITRPNLSSNSTVNPRAMGTTLWGDEPGEKMADFGGTYRIPNGDTFDGAQLPDYVTFCQSCHSQSSIGGHGGIDWDGDPHGKQSANQPNGYGVAPNWYSAGKAAGWDGDDIVDLSKAWPVITRGKGDIVWSRGPYNHEERIAGANFVLSCTDCHEAHGSGVSSMLRTELNDWPESGTVTWNTSCNSCHYYYSDWHAGMSCGTASCHVSNSIHRMGAKIGSGGTRTFDPDLVVDMRFNGNLKDSGTWQMDGVWRVTAGSFVSGISGNAIEIDDDPVEVGTENEYWSTDEGKHGTWKHTEMKYNMTLEAWVYPTNDSVDERKIMAKQNYSDGGYALTLKKVDGTYRAGLLVNVNGGGDYGVWDEDANGLRGAFSTVSIPLNQWTHIGATFNTAGSGRNSSDLSVGRVRIYVNGEDVTTSFPSDSQAYCQPSSIENSIFPYSEHSVPEDSVEGDPYYQQNPWGYAGHWCATPLSIGGMNWSDVNNNFVGRLDEVKIWNVTKDASYFAAIDSSSPPYISAVGGLAGSADLWITFSEEVYANEGGSGDLQPSDFTLTDIDDGRTIVSVVHVAGDNEAMLVLSSPLDDTDDLNVDTLAPASDAIYDEHDNAAGTYSVTITPSGVCPEGATTFDLDESAASSYVLGDQGLVIGVVNDPTESLPGGEYNGYFYGDGVDNYIDFEYNSKCLQGDTALTIEVRIKPSGIEGTDNYIKRVLARDTGGNYQVSVWRNNSWTNYNAPADAASIAFWLRPVDAHGGTGWKVVLTDYDKCPIVSDHWYKVKIVWDFSKTGGIPCDIFVDDQGTAGDDAGENWAGYINATDSDQSQLTSDRFLLEGDVIATFDGAFTIGANVNNHTKNVFNGLIDWITWSPTVDPP